MNGSSTNFELYNNTIVGYRKGGFNFWAITSNIIARNNIWYNCSGVGLYNVDIVSHNYLAKSFKQGNQWHQDGPALQEDNNDPFVDSANENFHLAVSTMPGYRLSSPFDMDPESNIRGLDGNWERSIRI